MAKDGKGKAPLKKLKPIIYISPTTKTVPPSIAASIGRIIVRHSYLDWLKRLIVFDLLGVHIKAGRAAYRTPPTGIFITQLKQLAEIQQIRLGRFAFGKYETALKRADESRNALAHSVFLKDAHTGRLRIQLVTGTWDIDRQKYETIYRAITPETPYVDRRFLAERRQDVNLALKMTDDLYRKIRKQLRALNEKRRLQSAMDRRRNGRS